MIISSSNYIESSSKKIKKQVPSLWPPKSHENSHGLYLPQDLSRRTILTTSFKLPPHPSRIRTPHNSIARKIDSQKEKKNLHTTLLPLSTIILIHFLHTILSCVVCLSTKKKWYIIWAPGRVIDRAQGEWKTPHYIPLWSRRKATAWERSYYARRLLPLMRVNFFLLVWIF